MVDLLRVGESQVVEFKSSARWNVQTGQPDKKRIEHIIVKAACGFLNAEGGTLLIGVADGGEILGLDNDLRTLGSKPNLDGYELFLRQRLDKSLSTSTAGVVRIRFERIDGKDVAVVSVAAAGKPVFAKGLEGAQGPNEFWVRIGNATKQLHGDDMVEYQENHWG